MGRLRAQVRGDALTHGIVQRQPAATRTGDGESITTWTFEASGALVEQRFKNLMDSGIAKAGE